MVTIEICLGSSCFSRGNSESLEIAENFIKSNGLDDSVKIVGNLCIGHCSDGPNIRINGNLHKNCTPDCILDLVKHYLRAETNEVSNLH